MGEGAAIFGPIASSHTPRAWVRGGHAGGQGARVSAGPYLNQLQTIADNLPTYLAAWGRTTRHHRHELLVPVYTKQHVGRYEVTCRDEAQRTFCTGVATACPMPPNPPGAEVASQPDFYYEREGVPGACIFVDGSDHLDPAQQGRDTAARTALEDRGYRVITIRFDRPREEQVGRHPDVFGVGG